MPLTEKGQKIMANMQREYGPKKGESVFYASRNAGRITGVDPGHARGGPVAGLVDHDFDPELPRVQDDVRIDPVARLPLDYIRVIQQLREGAREPPALSRQRGGTVESGKHTQQAVDYRRGYPLRQCSVCDMYRKSGGGHFGTCTNVAGGITPYGVCNIFARLDNPYGNRITHHHERIIGAVYDHAHGYQGKNIPYNNPRRGG
jgi:hypothetical protein